MPAEKGNMDQEHNVVYPAQFARQSANTGIVRISDRLIDKSLFEEPKGHLFFERIETSKGWSPDARLAQSQNPRGGTQSRRKMSDPTREEIEALIGKSEANQRIELTRLEGKIDTLTATLAGKIDNLAAITASADQYNHSTRWVLVSVVVGSVITLAALIVGLATYGDALFGRGMNVRDVVHSVVKEQQDLVVPSASQPPASPSSTQPAATTSKAKDKK